MRICLTICAGYGSLPKGECAKIVGVKSALAFEIHSSPLLGGGSPLVPPRLPSLVADQSPEIHRRRLPRGSPNSPHFFSLMQPAAAPGSKPTAHTLAPSIVSPPPVLAAAAAAAEVTNVESIEHLAPNSADPPSSKEKKGTKRKAAPTEPTRASTRATHSTAALPYGTQVDVSWDDGKVYVASILHTIQVGEGRFASVRSYEVKFACNDSTAEVPESRIKSR